jgi:predicted nucleotidyltransferase
MMRREDAEKLIGRKIPKENLSLKPYVPVFNAPELTPEASGDIGRKVAEKNSSWKDYVPIFSVSELAPKILRDNAIIAIHPGFKYYGEDFDSYMEKFSGYEEYLDKLKVKIQEADRSGRTVIVYSSPESITQTLQTIGPLDNLVLFPTDGPHGWVDSEAIKMSKPEFFEKLTTYIKQVELCGEWNEGCVDDAETELGKYIDLKVLHNHIFPSDEQLDKWRCRFPIDKLLTVPQDDYVVLIGGGDEFMARVQKTKKVIRKQLARKYNIKDGTCSAALLDQIVDNAGIDDSYEKVPYTSFYEMTEKWSKSTVRKNLGKMERNGLVDIQRIDPQSRKLYEAFQKAVKDLGVNYRFRKVVIPKIRVESSELDFDEKDLGFTFIKDCVVSVSADKLKQMEDIGYRIAKAVDIRGMNESERGKAALGLYQGMKKDRRASETKEKRIELITQAATKLKSMSNIKEAYITGSVANQTDGKSSDVDLLLIRESCSGMSECLSRFEENSMDVFCFTEGEMKGLKEKKALITTTLSRLK